MYPHFYCQRSLCLTGQNGTTPLMLAAGLGHDSIVTQLLKKQADPDTQNRVRAVDCTPCVVECWANDACEGGRTREGGWIESETSQRDLLEYTDFLLIHRWEWEGGCFFHYSLALNWLFFSSNLKNRFTWFEWILHYFEWCIDFYDISYITAGRLYSTYVSYTVSSCQHCEANPG